MKYSGFTMIEFVAVIVLLAILAVVALPEFLEPEDKARQSATNSVAAGLTAASASNYAIRKANSSKGTAISNCSQVGSLPIDLLPAGYTITPLAIAPDASISCTVTNPDGSTTATFVGMGVS